MISATEIDQMSDIEFRRQAFAAIVRELGLGGLARFIRLNYSGTGDYTAERHQWLGHLTVEDIARELGVQLPD